MTRLRIPASPGDTPEMRKRAALAAYASAFAFVPAAPILQYARGPAPGAEENHMGTASYSRDTDTIYFSTPMLERSARAHEAGHAFDDQVLTDGDRRYFQRLMGASPGEWRTGTGMQGGHSSPSEWFADYYQAAALGLDPRFESQAAYAQVGPKRLKRFEKALERLAKRRGITQQYK